MFNSQLPLIPDTKADMTWDFIFENYGKDVLFCPGFSVHDGVQETRGRHME